MKAQPIGNFFIQAAGALLFGFIATSLMYVPIDQALQGGAYEACDEFYEFGSKAHYKCTKIAKIESARRQKSYAYPLLVANTLAAFIAIRRKTKKNNEARGIQ